MSRRDVSGASHPESTSSWVSAVRACPATSSADSARWARCTSTSRACGYRRSRLGMQVVAVVPAGDEPEVAYRRERRSPGADHHPDPAAQHRQEGAVASGGSEVGGEHHVPVMPQRRGERGVDPGDVTGIRHADHASAATAQARGHGAGQRSGGVVPGQRRPGRARRPPRCQPSEQGGAALDLGPGALLRRGQRPFAAGGGVSLSTRACRGGTARRRTSDSVPA